MFFIFFIFVLLQSVQGEKILNELTSELVENPVNPLLVVACQDFDDECTKLQELVKDVVDSLNKTYETLESMVAEYSVVEHLQPQNPPVILLLKPGPMYLQFEDEVEFEPLRGWVYENLLPAVLQIELKQQYESISKSDIPILAFLFMRTFNENLAHKFELNAEAYNSDDVMFMAGTGEEFYDLLGDKEYRIQIRHKALNKTYYVEYDPDTSMSEFFAQSMFPLYEEFSPANMKMLEGRYMLWIFYKSSFAAYDEMFVQLAIKYQRKLVITKFDVESYDTYVKNFGLTQAPGISILHPNQRTTYPLKKDLKDITVESMEKYIENVLNGIEKPYLPSRNKEEVEYNEIVASEFEEVTKSNDCVVIVAGLSTAYKTRFVVPLEEKYPKIRTAFMNINYDELPPEILSDGELTIMVYHKGNGPEYFEQAFLMSSDALIEMVEETCELVEKKAETEVKEEL